MNQHGGPYWVWQMCLKEINSDSDLLEKLNILENKLDIIDIKLNDISKLLNNNSKDPIINKIHQWSLLSEKQNQKQ